MDITKTTTLVTRTDGSDGGITLTRRIPTIIVRGDIPANHNLIGFTRELGAAFDPDDILSLNEAIIAPTLVVGMYPVIANVTDGTYRTLRTEVRAGWSQDPRRRGALGLEDFHFAAHELMGEEFYENDTAPGMRLWAPPHHIEDVWMVTAPKGGPRLFPTMYQAIAYIMRTANTNKEEGN